MKKNFGLFIICLIWLFLGAIDGCKKDNSLITPNPSKSFAEEFEHFYDLTQKGWVSQDNSGFAGGSAPWGQGFNGFDKSGNFYGFPAYSKKADDNEYVYSSAGVYAGTYSISSWLITPVLSVKNGDRISFYTRADTGQNKNRMQVLMNKSISESVGGPGLESVGDFTTLLFDINPAQTAGGYPTTWTKYEYTFSGLTGKIDTRIGFRHYITNITMYEAKGIGIDQFRFQVN